MVSARVGMFPGRTLTASISPGNAAIEHIVARHGFEPGLMHAPWRMWHRRAQGAEYLADVEVLIEGSYSG